MRISWFEAACVVAIAVATLQLKAGDNGARLFTPPQFMVVKNAVVAAVGPRHADSSGTESRERK